MYEIDATLDLQWYFRNDSDRELGETSSFGAFVAMMMSSGFGGSGAGDSEPTERQLAAVASERRIRRALDSLGLDDVYTLFLRFSPAGRHLPVALCERFGELAPLAARTEAAQEAYAGAGPKQRKAMTVARWVAKRASPELRERIHEQARRSVDQAIARFVAARDQREAA